MPWFNKWLPKLKSLATWFIYMFDERFVEAVKELNVAQHPNIGLGEVDGRGTS